MKTRFQTIRKTIGCFHRLALALLLAPAGAWASPSYNIDFQVDGYAGTEALTNFPVLVRLSEASIPRFHYADCASDGRDLSFILPDMTELPREIEKWDPAGESFVWVRLPELQNGASFSCHYGDQEATEQPACQNDGSVWSGGYAGVWHFSEADGIAHDSTANRLDAVPQGKTEESIAVEGIIGAGRQNSVSANNPTRLLVPSYDHLTLGGHFTVSGWFHAQEPNSFMRLWSRKDPFNEKGGWELEVGSWSYLDYYVYGSNGDGPNGNLPVPLNSCWQHFVIVYDGKLASFYVNGELLNSAAVVEVKDNGKALAIGGNSPGNRANYPGYLDEMRLSRGVRSGDWIKAVYDMASNTNFISAGEAMPLSGGFVVQGHPDKYGTAIPAYGTMTGVPDGKNFECAVSAVATNEAEGVIATCSGWDLYDKDGNEVESGTGNSHSFVFNTFRRLVWNFDRQFKIDLQADGGSIAGAAAWEPEGKVLTLSPDPDEGNSFLRWAGDFPCAGSHEQTVTFTNDRPVTVVAVFRTKQPVRYHVAPDGDDKSNSGLCPESPFQTPEMALSCIKDGDSVVLDAGRYVVDMAISITNEVVFEGMSGKGEVILTREEASATNILVLAHSNAVVRGVVIDGNRAADAWRPYWMAGVDIRKEGGTLDHCVVRNVCTGNNHADGAGINMVAGLVRYCVITNNKVQSSGGGGAKGGGCRVMGGVVEHCYIHANQSQDGGGADGGGACVGGTGILRNCLVTDNIARRTGSGVWMNGGLVENCTIAGNRHSSEYDSVDCAGLRCYYGGTVRNTIIYGNWNTGGALNISVIGTDMVLEHCCSDFVPEVKGTGNINANPQFVDPDKGDYRLASGACIDAGTNQTWMTETETDFGGAKRISGEIVDIGCYEFTPSKLACSFDVAPRAGLGSADVSLTAHVAGTNVSDIVYTWNFGDGTEPVSGADKAEISHTFGPGVFTVTLKATNGKEEAVCVWPDCVNVAPLTAYVVTNNPSARIPYNTWKIAATNLHDVLAVCREGSTVIVSNGVYVSSLPVQVFKAIELHSVNGPEVTTLKIVHPDGKTKGNFPNFNVVYATDPGVVLDGFTITGAGRSALKFPKGGTIENCIVCGNKTINNTDEGSGIYMESASGTIRHCMIRDNYCKCSGGWGARGGGLFVKSGVLVDSCTIVSNLVGDGNVSRGGGIYSENSTVRNCLFAWNGSAHNAGGAQIYGGTIDNCTFASNYSLLTGGATDSARANHASGLSLVGNATARNLVVWANTFADDLDREVVTEGDDPEKNRLLNCLVSHPEALHGEGNFAGDPLFKNPSIGDFHLKSTSPARNVGLDLDWMGADAVDLDGNQRVFERKPDLGCYENVTFAGTMLLLR